MLSKQDGLEEEGNTTLMYHGETTFIVTESIYILKKNKIYISAGMNAV